MVRRGLDKLVMRAAGEQEKTVCGNLQLCAGLEASIEGETRSVVQRRREKVVQSRIEEDPGDKTEAEEEEGSNRDALRVEVDGTEEES